MYITTHSTETGAIVTDENFVPATEVDNSEDDTKTEEIRIPNGDGEPKTLALEAGTTTPPPTEEPEDPLTPEELREKRIIREAFKEAIDAKLPKIAEAVIAASAKARERRLNNEPVIDYDRRRRRLQFVFAIFPPGAALIGVVILFTLIADNLVVTSLMLILIAVAIYGVLKMIDRIWLPIDRSKKKQTWAARGKTSLILLAFVFVMLIIGIIFENFGINRFLTIGVMAITVVCLYISIREYYKWANHRIFRDGAKMRAVLPASISLMVDEINESIGVGPLVSVSVTSKFYHKILGIVNARIDGITDGDQYWHNLKFISGYDQLRASVTQQIYVD